ncbi:YjzD family protein [Lactiplantibacillus sp. WILCCON 0030]|uniref:YjzD family protein n=1 Tax=Lactiplantibacillus brownii TaxID=3069269 RepID=A0ABU1A9B2_9LACO|nr:YjzD family protein [Lactiplantibacillus brownii]MDQ7937456.1 YjzD family protein [Lactiplantibacillus brownii]
MTKQLVIIFWSVLFGEVIGYIGSALETMTYNFGEIGIISAVFALIVVNGISLITNHSMPFKGSENK